MNYSDAQFIWSVVPKLEALTDRQQIGNTVNSAAVELGYEDLTEMMNDISDDALFDILVYHLGRDITNPLADLEDPSDENNPWLY